MESVNKIEIAARNKANYLKAKEAFNKKQVDECILFYASNHEVKSKQSEKGREGIKNFLEGLHQTWPDIQITVEHAVAEDNWVMGIWQTRCRVLAFNFLLLIHILHMLLVVKVFRCVEHDLIDCALTGIRLKKRLTEVVAV